MLDALKEFTGGRDPNEGPEISDLTIATEACMLDGAADQIIRTLQGTGYFDPAGLARAA